MNLKADVISLHIEQVQDFSCYVCNKAIKPNVLFSSGIIVYEENNLFSNMYRRFFFKNRSNQREDTVNLCYLCSLEIIKERKEANAELEKQIRDWIKSNKGTLFMEKL